MTHLSQRNAKTRRKEEVSKTKKTTPTLITSIGVATKIKEHKRIKVAQTGLEPVIKL